MIQETTQSWDIILCADEESLRNPGLMGLDHIDLGSWEWLACESTALGCRNLAAQAPGIKQIWVVSCSDMEGINLAAALKKDNPFAYTVLISNEQSGSLASRAHAASIDDIWSTPKLAAALRDQATLHERAVARHHGEASQVGALGATDGRSSVGAPVPQATGAEASSGFVVSFMSGSGGSGKSTLCAIAALICTQAGLRTAVVDADLQFGDMQRLLGTESALRIDEVAGSPGRLGMLEPPASGTEPAVLAAPLRIEQSEEIAEGVGDVVDALRGRFDVVLVNTGCMWSDVQAVLLERSDQVVMVVAPRVSSMHATIRAMDLCARLGAATNGFCFALNRQTKSSLLSALDVSCAIRVSNVREVPDGGRDVEELASAGLIRELFGDKNEAVEGVRDLLATVAPEPKARAIQGGGSGQDASTRKRFGRKLRGSGA